MAPIQRRALVLASVAILGLFASQSASAQTSYTGQGLVYAARAGGRAVAVDRSGNAYLVESATAPDGRWPPGAFVTKLDGEGRRVIYRTFIGHADGLGIAVDASGNAYVAGRAEKGDFATTRAFITPGTGIAAFVVKLDAAGKLAYSVLVGGGHAMAMAVAVDAAGNAYVAGVSGTADFPTTAGAFDRTWNGGGFHDPASDGVVFKLDASGMLVYSTFLGGDDYEEPGGIAVDKAGNAYIGGRTISTNFPVTVGALQPVWANAVDGFVTKLNPTGSAVVYSTYIGGSESDFVNDIAIDAESNVYITGETMSPDFPTTPGSARTSLLADSTDLFVAKLNATGDTLVYGTYLGGSGSEFSGGLAVDAGGRAFVAGGTASADYPVTARALQTTAQGASDGFVTRLDGIGAILYSTRLGGPDGDGVQDMAIDSKGDVYLTGSGGSGFPVTAGTPTTIPPGSFNPFIARLVPRATLAQSATASSQESARRLPMAAIDGNPSTRWSSQFSDQQWYAIDLGRMAGIDRVILHWETAYASAYEVQVSDDGRVWSTVESTSSGDGRLDDLDLAATGRYVRILGIQRATEWGYSLWEVDIFGTPFEGANIPPTVNITAPADGTVFGGEARFDIVATATDPDGSVARVDFYIDDLLGFSDTAAPFMTPAGAGPGSYTIRAVAYDNLGKSGSDTIGIVVNLPAPGDNLAFGKPAFSSSNESPSLTAAKAFDNNAATRWSSAFSDPQWIFVDLGKRFEIRTVILKWQAAYASSFELHASDDGQTWRTIYSTTNGTGKTQTIGGLTGTARYVRMHGLRRATQWGYSLWDMEVYGTPIEGGPTPLNLASSRPTLASSSESASLAPAKATDLLMNTRWSSAFADDQWISVDLGALYDIERVVLRWESAYASHYLLQVSNDATIWRTVRDAFSDGGVDEFGDLPSVARYVRMFGLTRATPWGFSLWEFEVYGKPAVPGPNLALGATTMSSEVESARLASANATDGNIATRWSSAFQDYQWIIIDLGSAVNMTRLMLRWEAAYARRYTIRVSPDLNQWRTVMRVDASDGGVDDISIETGEQRYIQVTCDERATQWGCSLWELEVYGRPSVDTSVARWKILTLIYAGTDFQYFQTGGVRRHVIGTISPTQLTEAAAAATRFANEDIKALTSGHMIPELTIRYPGTLTTLTPNGGGWWPAPSDVGSARDPGFDAVWVIWQPNVVDQTTGQPLWIGSAAGLTLFTGTGQGYMALIVDAATRYGHLNVFKHEFGHSITEYFDAAGTAPKPRVENHTVAGTYVHCKTGQGYVWTDETDANPIPNSIYSNASGFTHDYYSGTTALASAPDACLGITAEAWASGGPVTRP